MQRNHLKNIFRIIVIIALFACIGYTNGNNRKTTIFEEIITDLFSMPQRIIVYVRNYVENDNVYFSNIETLKNENDELKAKVASLEEEMIDYEMLSAENEILKNHIRLSELYPDYSAIVADIIMNNASNWEYTYMINRGSNQGIEPNMAVISEEGLVGYIETVSDNDAKVVSILDAGNAVSARITRTRDTVISKGSIALAENKQMKITNIPIGVSLVEGDRIETSGLGGIYPKGILIGKIVSFNQKSNPLDNEAVVESFVDFDKLETVAVIRINQIAINNEED